MKDKIMGIDPVDPPSVVVVDRQTFAEGSAYIDEASDVSREAWDKVRGPALPPGAKGSILPGLPGGPPMDEALARAYVEQGGQVQPVLPADRLVEEGQEGDLVIFDDDDVRQAMKQFVTGGGYHRFSERKRLAAMRGIMMFALQIAAVNLGVK